MSGFSPNYTHKTGGAGALLTIAFRNIFRNARRTMFCVIAVGAAVFFIIFYSSLIGGMLASMREAVYVFELGHVRAVSAAYEAETEYNPVQYPVAEGKSLEAVLASIRAIPEVRAAFPRISAYATLQETSIKHAALWGLNMAEEAAANHFNLTDRNNGLVEGRYPEPHANECAVGARFAEKAGLGIGDTIPLKTLSAQFSDKLFEPVITGIFRFDYAKADGETIILDFKRLQRLLSLGDAAQQIVVYGHSPTQSGPIAAALAGILNSGDVITRWEEQYWIVLMDAYQPLYYAMYLVFLVVACLLIVNTITMIIHERIKEIGMMGSLGMTRAEIVRVFFFESVFLAMAGATAGLVLGGLLTGIGQFFPVRWTGMMGGESAFAQIPAASAIFFAFSPAGLLKSWCMGVAVASLFTLIPSLKSAFVEPVEALRR
ncbi:MAG: FtsX-like permease family protein [Spirochaetaceae bacterium]|jgi:putative ABC transport system permease protein|nr:FtsX-like permease family protein [Spirochaetaceae bacterium]